MTRPRQPVQGPRGLLGHLKLDSASGPGLQPAWRADQGGGVEAGERVAPGRPGGIEVSLGQPGDEPTIRRRRGQLLPLVAGEDLLHQDRQRPAIEHDVVKSQHNPVPVFGGADHRHPEDRLVGEVADRGAFGGAHPSDLLVGMSMSSNSTYCQGM